MDEQSVPGGGHDDRAAVIDVVRGMARNGQESIGDDDRLVADLGYDSLRLIELAIALEQHLGLPRVELEEAITVVTVGDAVEMVGRVRAGERS